MFYNPCLKRVKHHNATITKIQIISVTKFLKLLSILNDTNNYIYDKKLNIDLKLSYSEKHKLLRWFKANTLFFKAHFYWKNVS